jgi:hypothetical protein
LTSGAVPEWEAQDPPSGCSQEGALLARGQYLVSSYLPALVELLESVLKDAVASGELLFSCHADYEKVVHLCRTIFIQVKYMFCIQFSGLFTRSTNMFLISLADMQA